MYISCRKILNSISYRHITRYLSVFGRITALLIIFFLSDLTGEKADAQVLTSGYEEISVAFHVENLPGFYSSALYSSDGRLLVSVEELFQNIGIVFSPIQGKPGIEGFIENERQKFIIDYSTSTILCNDKLFNLSENQAREENVYYLESSLYGTIFGLHLSFNFRSLSSTVKPDFELPAIKEKRLEEARRSINRNRGESLPADTIIKREYHALRFGMADWYLMSNQVWDHSTEIQAGIGLGAEILGGETNIFINYSDKFKFDRRMQNYSWRWVDNSKNIIKQVRLGRITPQTVSSIYFPVTGVSVGNSPTTTRRAKGEYTIKDFTEPDWLVELYINNELVDYTRADASGLYVFSVPLVYGFTTLTLRFYGPMGEERSDIKTINVPYNFMPAGEFEYNINAGFLQDGKTTPFARAETAFGVTKSITLGAGLEYLSSITGQHSIPFAKVSFLPFSKLILTGEYDFGVRFRGTANYYPIKSVLVEADYIHYMKDQKAILYNYLEEKKISVSIPARLGNVSGFARLGYKQNVYQNFNYNIVEILFSGYYRSFNANFSTYANWMNGNALYVNSTAALSLHLKYGITLRSTTQFNLSKGKILLYKEEFEKKFSRSGYLSLYFEDNLAISNRSLNLSLKCDLNFAQATSSARASRNEISTFQGLRGSLMFGKKTRMVQADATSNVGRGGITIIPFLDINYNGRKDRNEKHIENLDVRLNGGRIKYIEKDTVIIISGLEPFISYFVELSDRNFENLAWRLAKTRYEIMIDPNQFKTLEIPVIPMGEVNGMITISRDSVIKGLGRVIVRIYDISGSLTAETLSEQDGYWSYLGLKPGEYYCTTDSLQMARLNISASGKTKSFSIKPDEYGDITGNLNFELIYNAPVSNEDNQNVKVETEHLTGDVTKGNNDYYIERNSPATHISAGIISANNEDIVEVETGKANTGDYYYIQAGAFENILLGKKMVHEISRFTKYASVLVKEENMYKIKIGYFRKKSEALAVKDILEKNNIPSFIGTSPAFVYEGNLDTEAGKNFVQTGAFRNEEFARALLKRVSILTDAPSGIIIEDGYFKVRTGYFNTPAQARSVNNLIRKANLESFRGDMNYYNE